LNFYCTDVDKWFALWNPGIFLVTCFMVTFPFLYQSWSNLIPCELLFFYFHSLCFNWDFYNFHDWVILSCNVEIWRTTSLLVLSLQP
jgi:hypothetical protein